MHGRANKRRRGYPFCLFHTVFYTTLVVDAIGSMLQSSFLFAEIFVLIAQKKASVLYISVGCALSLLYGILTLYFYV